MEQFICPITHEIFLKPVLASDGNFYEKDAIKKWIQHYQTSPITREIINNEFYKCHYFRGALNEYITNNPNAVPLIYSKLRLHKDNIYKVNNYIDDGEIDNLLKYSGYDLEIFFDHDRLMDVLLWKNLDTVKYIIDNIVDLSIDDESNCSLLHYAIMYADTEIIRYLVDKGMDIEKPDSDGKRPIHIAIIYNRVEVVKLLIDHDVDIESSTNYNQFPLHMAASLGNEEIVWILLDGGVDIKRVGKNNYYPHHHVFQYLSEKIIKYFIETYPETVIKPYKNKGIVMDSYHFIDKNITLADKNVYLNIVRKMLLDN